MPSTRSHSIDLEIPISSPKRLIRLRRRIQYICIPEPVEDQEMAQPPRPLKSYAIPSQEEPHNSIAAPIIEANSLELKPSLLLAIEQN